MPPISEAWFWVWGVMALVMAGLWLRQTRTQNANAVDVAWSLGFSLTAIIGACVLSKGSWRPFMVGSMTLLWSLRLGTYLLRTRVLNGKPEDARYSRLRTESAWGQKSFFFMYQFQALLVAGLSVSILTAMLPRDSDLRFWDILGVMIWLIALLGESIADRQLSRFLTNPTHRGRTCQEGLWRYSRHPNYFFEWLHWWAYAVIAIGTPYAAWAFSGPLLMLWFLVKVTGIPATERQARRSRPDYAEYQRQTSAFIPWLRKD